MSTDNEIVVIIAVDGSDFSHTALKWYLRTLYRPEFNMKLVHCVEPLSVIGEVASPEAYERMLSQSKQNAEKIEERYNEVLKEFNVAKGSIITIFGNKPGEVLMETAKKEHASMLVVGARGLSKVRRTMLGSVSDYLVHHSLCPVIVCRDPSQDGRSSLMD